MRDFGRWLAEQASPANQPDAQAAQLPDGFWDQGDRIMVRCCACEREFCISDYISFEEIMASDPDRQYCGGSPGCMP